MTTTILGLVTLDRQNGLVRDQCVNTWHFQIDEVDPIAECGDIAVALQAFYTNIDGAMSPVLTGDGTMRFYDLAAPVPRVPLVTASLGLVTSASNPLPSECAVALSYHGTFVSGSPVARRRGRIFLGPWSVDALADGISDGAVATATLNAIAGAANTLSGAGVSEGWSWAVFSPTTAGPQPWSTGELLGATLTVTNGWVDNAFDTIRSRGGAATDRVTF